MSRENTAKERILNTASDLFYRRGYKEVGINEIIKESGTAKATFYSNYHSKEVLAEAWLEKIHDSSEVKRAALLKDLTDPWAVLECYFKELEKFLKKSQFRGCPFTNTAAVLTQEEPSLQRQIYEHKKSVRNFFRKLAKHALADTKKAKLLGDRVFVLYSGATAECQNLQTLWPVKVARDACKELWQAALDS